MSLVVASPGAEAHLRACLDVLVPVCRELDMEIIVVRGAAPGEIARCQAAYPLVRFVAAPAGSSIAALRAVGLAAAHGDIVVLTQDDPGVALATVRRRAGLDANRPAKP